MRVFTLITNLFRPSLTLSPVSRTSATKEVFRLVRQYQLPGDLVENLFSAHNVWRCLEFAVEVDDPTVAAEAFLLQKCEKMLRQNRRCYQDAEGMEGIKASTIAFALHLPALPMKTSQELKEFIR